MVERYTQAWVDAHNRMARAARKVSPRGGEGDDVLTDAPKHSKTVRAANKYHNVKQVDGSDSKKEGDYGKLMMAQRKAVKDSERVVKVEKHPRFLIIPKQKGENGAWYTADYRVEYADGHVEVVDIKSDATRGLPDYVLRRKLLLLVHGIRLKEVNR